MLERCSCSLNCERTKADLVEMHKGVEKAKSLAALMKDKDLTFFEGSSLVDKWDIEGIRPPVCLDVREPHELLQVLFKDGEPNCLELHYRDRKDTTACFKNDRISRDWWLEINTKVKNPST
eukprot:Filipodium_phascolosomae@DN2522_c0_g1_i6.p2